MAKENNIYTVVPKDGSPARLVEANSKAAVVHHLAADKYEITVSTQHEIVQAIQAGVVVEKAAKPGPGGKTDGEPSAEPA